MMRLFKGLKGLFGHWEQGRRRNRVAGHCGLFGAAVEALGEIRLAEAHQLLYELWSAGHENRALQVLAEECRQVREEEARRRKAS
jgi:hypothetical protein